MKSAPWFRLYHRMIDDEKIRLLAFEDRWHFIAILCLKADGLLDEDDSSLKQRKLAVKLGVQLRELDEIKRRLSEVGLVDDDMQPIAWDDLQYKSDTSTDRVRKYREKTKSQATETECNVSGNVSVTAQETDTETDNTSSLRSDVSASAKKQDQLSEAIEAYSDMASRCNLPAVRVLNDARKRKLGSLLKTHGLPVWLEALAKVEASDFCLGRKGDFRVDLDFMLQQSTFTRILEGRYDNRQGARPAEPPPKPQKKTAGTIFTQRARQMGILNDEPDRTQTGLRQESYGSRNGDVLDLTFEPSSEGGQQRGSGGGSLFHRP